MAKETGKNSVEKPIMDPEEEAAFIRNMLGFIERHGLGTPDFITAHIHALDSFGATEMADFWRDALAIYDRAYSEANRKVRGDMHLRTVAEKTVL